MVPLIYVAAVLEGSAPGELLPLLLVHETLGALLGVRQRQGGAALLVLGEQPLHETLLALLVDVEALRLGGAALPKRERRDHRGRQVELHHSLHLLLRVLAVQNELPDLVVLRAPVDGPILRDGVRGSALDRFLAVAQGQRAVRSGVLPPGRRAGPRELLVLHFYFRWI